jgi:hypothetical protein
VSATVPAEAPSSGARAVIHAPTRRVGGCDRWIDARIADAHGSRNISGVEFERVHAIAREDERRS